MRELIRRTSVVVILLSGISIGSYSGCTTNSEGIEIRSCILRDRIIVMDQLIRKKALYVAFSRNSAKPGRSAVHGQLIHQGQIISQSSLQKMNGLHGSLFFDLPAEIPDGSYTVAIQLLDGDKIINRISKTVGRETFNSVFIQKKQVIERLPQSVAPVVKNPAPPPWAPGKIRDGYIVFQRSPLRYVHPEESPGNDEVIRRIAVNVVKNEYESIPFSIYALKDLGRVSVQFEWDDKDSRLSDQGGVTINHIESVEEQRGAAEGTYRKLPGLIMPGESIRIEKGRSERFWLTLHIPEEAVTGISTASILITPEKGPQTRIPLEVRVNDITLQDIPGVHYFMLMTYEFTELVHNWSDDAKKQIYEHACRILKDYKAHGMTALCPHSPFIPIEDSHGDMNLSDIKAALIAARDVGLKGPVIWYMGHLIQTAKPKHPGSILGFEPQRSYEVLEKLVREMDQFAHDHHCPQLVFLPIDESDDQSQDFHGIRFDITNSLLEKVKSHGGVTAVTAVSFDTFKPKDFHLTSSYSEKDLRKAHEAGCAYIEYNNDVTTRCTNPAYARYVYGYRTWQRGLDGICSWTFQNTQTASGDPRLADTGRKDIYLAYPDPHGPLATLMWEAVRDGIEDHKLLYQLRKRIQVLSENGHNVNKYKYLLGAVREKTIAPDCSESVGQVWSPEGFEQTKQDIIRMILEADILIRESQEPVN